MLGIWQNCNPPALCLLPCMVVCWWNHSFFCLVSLCYYWPGHTVVVMCILYFAPQTTQSAAEVLCEMETRWNAIKTERGFIGFSNGFTWKWVLSDWGFKFVVFIILIILARLCRHKLEWMPLKVESIVTTVSCGALNRVVLIALIERLLWKLIQSKNILP